MSTRPEYHRFRTPLCALALVSLAYAMGGCGGPAADAPSAAAKPAEAEDAPLPPPAYESALPEGVREHLYEGFTGDLDEMVKRRLVRVGVTFNRTFYFVDKGVQRGARLRVRAALRGAS